MLSITVSFVIVDILTSFNEHLAHSVTVLSLNLPEPQTNVSFAGVYLSKPSGLREHNSRLHMESSANQLEKP